MLTEVYFVNDVVPKMYFKPSRPLAEDEMQTTTQLVEADANLLNLFTESEDMKNTTYLLKGLKPATLGLTNPTGLITKRELTDRLFPAMQWKMVLNTKWNL